jgi:hypothetical protein
MSTIDLFEMINTTQKGALPGSGRTDNDHHLVLTYFEVDIFKNVQGSEIFIYLLGLNYNGSIERCSRGTDHFDH